MNEPREYATTAPTATATTTDSMADRLTNGAVGVFARGFMAFRGLDAVCVAFVLCLFRDAAGPRHGQYRSRWTKLVATSQSPGGQPRADGLLAAGRGAKPGQSGADRFGRAQVVTRRLLRGCVGHAKPFAQWRP